MKSRHNKIRELLPDYLKGALDDKKRCEVMNHLIECEECRSELCFLGELASIKAPDAGELFWQTMPGKVTAAIKRGNPISVPIWKMFLRPAVVAAVVSITAVISAYFMIKGPAADSNIVLNEPPTVLTAGIPEASPDKTVRHNPVRKTPAQEQPAVAGTNKAEEFGSDSSLGEEFYAAHEDPLAGSVYGELAALDAKELEGLYQALAKDQHTGG